MSNSALSNRSFLIYLAGSTVSLHGLWIYRVALGWFTWQLTGSEFWVGIVAFTQFAPAVIFGPLFGVLADRTPFSDGFQQVHDLASSRRVHAFASCAHGSRR